MEQCRVIAITNQKGGVGKTTTTVNLGVGLAKQGKRVLLIDADPQGSLTISLGERNPDQLSETLSDVMECIINDKSLPENFGLLRSSEGVDLMPANIELSGTEVGLFNVMSREYVLKSYIDSVSKNYDYILIDCMPSLGMMTINALAAADRVIIPSQPSFLSTKGLNQLMHSVAKVKRQINPRLNIDGILLTMVDNRTNNAKAISTALRAAVSDRVRVFDTQIPFSVRAAESAQEGQSIFAYDKGGNLTVTKTVNRLGTVFFLFLFNIGISVFVFLLTGMMIFSQVLFIIYAMFLPVSFVLSMAPTFEGSSRRAVIKLFNTILARAGITLVITVAFSISTMLYRIASGYPFFIIAFLQVVVFAGIYFKLGDLLSIFSLHDDGARGMGRYIMHRPRMFLHHQLHRLNRTMRAATASRPNDGGSAQNSRSSSASGGAYRYRSNRPNGGSSGASQPGAVHSLPETSAKEITSGGVSHTEGYADKAVSADAENRRPDAPAVYLLGAARQVSGQSETDMPRQAADSDSAAPDSAHRATESNARPMAVPVSHNYDISDRKNMKQAEQSSIHARPAVAAPAAKPVQEEGQRTAAKQPAPPQQERPVSPVHSTETQPHERPAAVAAPKLVSSTGNASSNPAPHKRPLAAQPVSTVQQAAPQTEAAKQPVHVGIRRTDAVNRPAVRQDAEGKPVMPMQENHAAREQDKPAVSRPAVKGSVVSKRASAKGKAGKAQRKNASSPKNRGDSNTSRTDSTKDGGGGR